MPQKISPHVTTVQELREASDDVVFIAPKPPYVVDSSQKAKSRTSADSATRTASMLASAHVSLSKIAAKAAGKNGLFLTLVYVIFATLLAVSTYGLSIMGNTPVDLGVEELAWFNNIFDILITTLMQGSTSILDIKNDVLP